MIPVEQKSHRFLELDSLRGLAALAVVFSHFRFALGAGHPVFAFFVQTFASGRAAVVLFFLLSGFVLTVPYLGSSRPTYLAFLLKRICRLYLPYALAILIAAAFASRLYSTVPSGNLWEDLTWHEPVTRHMVLQHLTLIGHFDDTQLNTAAWTLVIEMRVSLLFPLIVWLVQRVRASLLLAAFVPFTLVLAYLSQHTAHQMVCVTAFYSMLFVAGSLMRWHYHGIRKMLQNHRRATIGLLLLALPCVGMAGAFTIDLRYHALSAYVVDLICGFGAATILMLSTMLPTLRHWLHGRVVMWLGTRSYSIYLLHGTVLFTLIRLHPEKHVSYGSLPIYLVVTMLAAEVFHRAVEVPALQLGRRVASARVPNSRQLVEG